jgi:hypothetical protein
LVVGAGRAAFIVLRGLLEQQERNGVITRDEINAILPSGAQSIPGRAKRRRSSVDQKLEALAT